VIPQIICFLAVTGVQRNHQKFSEGLKGLATPLAGKLGSFQSGVLTGKKVMAKQTRITIETDSLLMVRGRGSRRAWCPLCAAEGEMIALENVGVISNLEEPALEEWLNSGELHRSQATDGSELICLNSLLARVRNTKTC
jgi:hypothetical protein